jgi:hypothetical protein
LNFSRSHISFYAPIFNLTTFLIVVLPTSKLLACADVGKGALAPVSQIVAVVTDCLETYLRRLAAARYPNITYSSGNQIGGPDGKGEKRPNCSNCDSHGIGAEVAANAGAAEAAGEAEAVEVVVCIRHQYQCMQLLPHLQWTTILAVQPPFLPLLSIEQIEERETKVGLIWSLSDSDSVLSSSIQPSAPSGSRERGRGRGRRRRREGSGSLYVFGNRLAHMGALYLPSAAAPVVRRLVRLAWTCFARACSDSDSDSDSAGSGVNVVGLESKSPKSTYWFRCWYGAAAAAAAGSEESREPGSDSESEFAVSDCNFYWVTKVVVAVAVTATATTVMMKCCRK